MFFLSDAPYLDLQAFKGDSVFGTLSLASLSINSPAGETKAGLANIGPPQPPVLHSSLPSAALWVTHRTVEKQSFISARERLRASTAAASVSARYATYLGHWRFIPPAKESVSDSKSSIFKACVSSSGFICHSESDLILLEFSSPATISIPCI